VDNPLNFKLDGTNGNFVVRQFSPVNHQAYTFYFKVSAVGGSSKWFGPHNFDQGCTTTSVSFADNGALVTTASVIVGDSISNIYTFAQPTATRAWCNPQSNIIRNPDGTQWSGSSQIDETGGCSSQPCSQYSLVATAFPETIIFAIETYFDNLSWLSVPITVTISCGNAYTITEAAPPIDPQFIPHLDAAVRYALPSYTHTWAAGCPINNWEVSLVSGIDVALTDIDNIVYDILGVKTVKPADTSVHTETPH